MVAVDESSGIKVIIENQLESSNHEHLGKIITYASGLDAQVVVWIVKNAKEEHRSAIEWLNNNTNRFSTDSAGSIHDSTGQLNNTD